MLASVCLLWALAACAPISPPAGEQPSRRIAISTESARRLPDRVAEAMDSDGSVRLLINEEELNSYLVSILQDTWVRAITVWLTEEGVYVSAEFRFLGPRSMQAALDITTDHGKPTVRVRRAALDGHPLPRFLLASIQEAMNDALADAHLPVRMDRTVFGEGFVLVSGTKN